MATLAPSEQPDMIGGMGSLYMNIRYPREAIRKGIEGRVMLHFRIDEDGKPTQIEVARSLHPLCDSAAVQGLRAVRFAPAMRDGKRIPVYMKLPVRFQITGPSLSDGQRRDRSEEDRPRND
jgi:TonB family protein